MRLGVLGGTFDPVHNGHLFIAEEARSRFELEKVLFVLSARPPHKKEKISEVSDRLNMLEMALYGNPHFELSRIEVERAGISYTVDTLRELQKIYGNDLKLFLIIGADELLNFKTWKLPEIILSLCDVIAATRPGFNSLRLLDSVPQVTAGGLPSKDKIFFMETLALEVSSTEIRERVRLGKPFRYLVPEEVWRFISEKGLYA